MSNALEQASLIMVPSGYEDGTLGSLKPTDGTGDFTFSRGSNTSATRVNADGNIEKGYENLLLQSNSFLTTWQLQNGADITPNHSGYDGTNDAWYLYKDTGTSSQTIRQPIVLSGVQTFSFYAKAGELEWVRFLYTGSSSGRSHFHLAGDGDTGALINAISATIELIGNGWYKCSTSFNNTTDRVYIYPASSNNNVSGTSGGIYIQDAMVNQGLVAYPYIETTTAPVAGGILEDMPRLDYSNGSCPALLLEPERTNLVTNSEYITQPVNGTNTYNQGISPEGVNNAVKYTADSTFPNIRFSGISITAGTQYTFSCFVKYVGYQWMYINFNAGFTNDFTDDCWFDIENGELGTIGSNITNSSIESYGNGWYRISATSTAVSTGTGQIRLHNTGGDNVNTLPSNETGLHNLIYGAQIEDATYPTSYIPTYGVSQTRLADITDRGSNLAYTGDYTFFAEFELTEIDVYFLGANPSSGYSFMIRSDDTLIQFGRTIGTSADVVFTNTTDWESLIGTTIKMAFYKSGTSFKLFINGTPYTPTTNNLTTGDEVLDWRYINVSSVANRQEQAYIKKLVEFQTALTDSECIELTTIS